MCTNWNKSGRNEMIFLATKSASRILWFVSKLKMAFSTIRWKNKISLGIIFGCNIITHLSSRLVQRIKNLMNFSDQIVVTINCLSFDWTRVVKYGERFLFYEWQKIREKMARGVEPWQNSMLFSYFPLWKTPFYSSCFGEQ